MASYSKVNESMMMMHILSPCRSLLSILKSDLAYVLLKACCSFRGVCVCVCVRERNSSGFGFNPPNVNTFLSGSRDLQ